MNTRAGVHRDLGLTDDEYEAIVARLDREPTYTELAMFSVMWSEHCSYKSSRVHLKDLPTEAPHVLVGPGEGAGIIEVAPGVAVAWKIESHNHPSFVEPFNGAATGIGGIVRDVLSMGARPIALMDPLRFGDLDDARTRYLVEGVVSGISSYGNSIGVPTVGGETVFDPCYSGNPLVNVACLGIVETKMMRGVATGAGNQVVLYGSSTGRDGIGGASVLASAEFDADSSNKRPSVQVGDPFTEKLLIESSLELIARELLVGLQDLGAGGISCPTSEMTAKSGTGMRIDIENVHRREPGMEPFEVMISESQERMMAVVEPEKVPAVIEVCERWGLTARVIGEVTDGAQLSISDGAEHVATIPPVALADEAPIYDRPATPPAWLEEIRSSDDGGAASVEPADALMRLLGSPNIASKEWIWRQYDHMIFLGTVIGPGGDAAVIRLPDQEVAVAISVDGPGRLCYLDPYEGAVAAVAEAARNVACSGARPLAITNCLNFGNPEKPGVMWQFKEVVRGIGDACAALGTPVTGGNVSFYNETDGKAIHPTPVIGMLGSLQRAEQVVGIGFQNESDVIVLLGATRENGFAGSEYAWVINGVAAGRIPPVDLGSEAKLISLLGSLAHQGLAASAHDVSSGGASVAMAECAFRGGIGFSVRFDGDQHPELFGESPGRVILSCSKADLNRVLASAERAGVPASTIGEVGGAALDFGSFSVPLEDAKETFEGALGASLSTSIK